MEAPIFEVDPLWPKPLPNEWLLGMTIGVSVDAQDNVWIVHRGAATLHNNEKGAELNPPIAACCRAPPPVLAFNPDGDVVHAWGGPGEGYEWPESNHGIFVDYKGNVWIGGNGAKDAQILKFTQDGKFLMQSGHQGKNGGSNDPENFGRVAQIYVDPKTNEAYVADGYGNKRVAVLDADTGKIKRYWGAYGNKPDDTPLAAYKPDGAAGAAVPQPRALRRAVERRSRSTSATGRATACRCSRPTASSSRRSSSPRTRSAPARPGTSRSRKDPAAALHLHGRRPERARPHHRARRRCRADRRSATAGASRASSTACTASPSIPRATFYKTNYRGKTHAEIQLQGHRQCAGRRARLLWPKRSNGGFIGSDCGFAPAIA